MYVTFWVSTIITLKTTRHSSDLSALLFSSKCATEVYVRVIVFGKKFTSFITFVIDKGSHLFHFSGMAGPY